MLLCNNKIGDTSRTLTRTQCVFTCVIIQFPSTGTKEVLHATESAESAQFQALVGINVIKSFNAFHKKCKSYKRKQKLALLNYSKRSSVVLNKQLIQCRVSHSAA